jgi:hypothetical protein
VTDDLRQRYADAIARWALMYPIPAWSLSEGERAEKLARNWGRVAAEAVLAVRDDALAEALHRVEQAEAAVARVRAIAERARPVGGLGCSCPDDVPTCGFPEWEWLTWDLNPADVLGALDVPADGEQPPTPATEETDHG